MKNIIQESFCTNLLIMKIFGLYPPEKHNYLNTVLPYIPYVLFVVLIPVLNILHYLLAEEFDIVAFNYNAEYTCEAICFILKLLYLIKKKHGIKSCINYFGDPYFHTQRTSQKLIIEDCVKVCKRNSVIFLSGVTACVIAWIASPFFSEEYTLPIDIWLPFNTRANFKIYYTVYFYLTLGLLYLGFAATAADPLIGGLACHAAYQLKILKNNLVHLDEYTKEEIYGKMGKENEHFCQNQYFKILQANIKKCVNHHYKILRFTYEFEECFSLIVFSQFTAGLLSLSFCILQFGKMTTYFDFNVFVSISSICIVIAQLYFYCYYGSMLFEENNSLSEAIYISNWYKYDTKSRKCLIILMERSKKPIIITAGKILQLSLDTFTTILKRAYSLCAVLRTYQ